MSQKLESSGPMLRQLVDDAEVRTALRLGAKRPVARAALARQWGVSFWTLTNFRRGRLKDLRVAMRDRIQAGLASAIESEIRKLEHELTLVRKSGATLPDAKILQATIALEEARAFLKGSHD